MSNVKTFLNFPISFEGKFLIYPPTVNDVVGNDKFGQYQQMLILSHEELEDTFVDKVDDKGQPVNPPTPLEFLLGNAYYNEDFRKIALEAFEHFIHQKVTFLHDKKAILIGDLEKILLELESSEDLTSLEEKMILLTEENFLNFQNAVRDSLGLDKVSPPNPNEHPRLKRMKAKARLRDRIKAQKGMGISLEDSLVSICCMGIGLNPLNIGEISYASVGKLMRRYQEKEKYDIDIRSLLAGADSKKIQPKYWIRKLED